jgi:hypothetical protein
MLNYAAAVPVQSSVYFIPKDTQWILIKSGIEDLNQDLSGDYHFGPYQSNVKPTIHEAQIKLCPLH